MALQHGRLHVQDRRYVAHHWILLPALQFDGKLALTIPRSPCRMTGRYIYKHGFLPRTRVPLRCCAIIRGREVLDRPNFDHVSLSTGGHVDRVRLMPCDSVVDPSGPTWSLDHTRGGSAQPPFERPTRTLECLGVYWLLGVNTFHDHTRVLTPTLPYDGLPF